MSLSGGSAQSQPFVPLYRGSAPTGTLTGAFGLEVRETRITAVLGYLISRNPSPFQELFGIPGAIRRIGIESRHDDGRSDIFLETSAGQCVIEAKLDATDPLRQASRYRSRYMALLCFRRRSVSSSRNRVRYVHWEDLGHTLRSLRRSRDASARVLSQDLLQYLEDKAVIKRNESFEIYAREINEERTLGLFLRAQMYGCDYKAGSRLAEARYFAPHFGMRVANDYPGVTTGISYIAKVEAVQTVETWREMIEVVTAARGKVWYRQHQDYILPLRGFWRWPKQRSILLLGEPRLAFNPPISKSKLQGGRGYLSKQFFAFDQFYAAWRK